MDRIGFFFIILLFSCSINYKDTQFEENLSDKIPDTVLYQFTFTKVKNGTKNYEITASKSANYPKRKTICVEDVQFTEYDRNKKVKMNGGAKFIEYNLNTQDAEMNGSLFLFSAVKETEIRGEFLKWVKNEKQLTGRPDQIVTLKKTSGSTVEGMNFHADLKQNTVTFEGSVKGKYVEK